MQKKTIKINKQIQTNNIERKGISNPWNQLQSSKTKMNTCTNVKQIQRAAHFAQDEQSIANDVQLKNTLYV